MIRESVKTDLGFTLFPGQTGRFGKNVKLLNGLMTGKNEMNRSTSPGWGIVLTDFGLTDSLKSQNWRLSVMITDDQTFHFLL